MKPDYLLTVPYPEGEDLLVAFKKMVQGIFLEQNLIRVCTNERVHPWIFSAHVAGRHSSLEEGLLHEIAHAIQLKSVEYPRLKRGTFFHRPSRSVNRVMGRDYYEPTSFEPSLRESETVAIQLVLLEMLGYVVDHELFYRDWIDTLSNGSMSDHVKNREEMLGHLIRGFYLGWKYKPHLLEARFKNYCVYVSKIIEKQK